MSPASDLPPVFASAPTAQTAFSTASSTSTSTSASASATATASVSVGASTPPPSLRVHSIRALWDELDLLSAALADGELSWLGPPAETQRWDSALYAHSEPDPAAPLPSSARSLAHARLSVALVDPAQAHAALIIAAYAPTDPGADGPVRLDLSISAPDFAPPHIARAAWIAGLRQELLSYVTAQCESYISAPNRNGECDESDPEHFATTLPPDDSGGQLFDIYTILHDWTSLHPLPLPFSGCPSVESTPGDTDYELDDHNNLTEEMKLNPMALRVHMHRQIFWTHHLLSKEKQRELSSWADELGCWLVVKLGYPGFLLFEGPKAGLAQSSTTDATSPPPSATASSAGAGALELSRRIRAMQWAKLTTKTRTEWTWSAMTDLTLHKVNHPDLSTAESAALLACPLARACAHPLNETNGAFTYGPPFLPAEDPTKDPARPGKKTRQRSANASPALVPAKGARSVAEYTAAWEQFARANVGPGYGLKTRTRMIKTDSVGDLVLLLRRAGLGEEEIMGGLGIRGAQP